MQLSRSGVPHRVGPLALGLSWLLSSGPWDCHGCSPLGPETVMATLLRALGLLAVLLWALELLRLLSSGPVMATLLWALGLSWLLFSWPWDCHGCSPLGTGTVTAALLWACHGYSPVGPGTDMAALRPAALLWALGLSWLLSCSPVDPGTVMAAPVGIGAGMATPPWALGLSWLLSCGPWDCHGGSCGPRACHDYSPVGPGPVMTTLLWACHGCTHLLLIAYLMTDILWSAIYELIIIITTTKTTTIIMDFIQVINLSSTWSLKYQQWLVGMYRENIFKTSKNR